MIAHPNARRGRGGDRIPARKARRNERKEAKFLLDFMKAPQSGPKKEKKPGGGGA